MKKLKKDEMPMKEKMGKPKPKKSAKPAKKKKAKAKPMMGGY